ncbi:hypothetical protein ON010_g13079 [Phytophthora cinnamomi]|nr:hypothetical protein ON010_g13079 [Phytophthora cinnamomi]
MVPVRPVRSTETVRKAAPTVLLGWVPVSRVYQASVSQRTRQLGYVDDRVQEEAQPRPRQVSAAGLGKRGVGNTRFRGALKTKEEQATKTVKKAEATVLFGGMGTLRQPVELGELAGFNDAPRRLARINDHRRPRTGGATQGADI